MGNQDNNKNKDNMILSIIVFVVVMLVIIQNVNNFAQIMQLNKGSEITGKSRITEMPKPIGTVLSTWTGSATYDNGMARMCINAPPIITYDCNLTNSNSTINITDEFNCTINATDFNMDSLIYYLTWNTTPAIFTITRNGTMNFTPKRAAIDRINRFYIHVEDNSICENNYTIKEYNVMLIGGNRPPRLIKNIPNQTIIKDQFYMFHITDYFIDPDEDPLFFFYIFQSGNATGVRIMGNTVEVKGLDCGISEVYYVAVDPFGLAASSNTVRYNITCPGQSNQPLGSNTANTGRGGRGGSSYARECEPQWRCGAWSECLIQNFSYRRCLDYGGCSNNYEKFFFQNCTYILSKKECKENWECNAWGICNNGIHTRMCMDLNNCGTNTSKPAESENCNKIPSCFNGIQDNDETGIDCGGSCGACRNIEQPKKAGANIAAIIAGIFILFTFTILMVMNRKKINATLKKMFGRKPRVKHKIYINDKQKTKLLQILNVAQARVDEQKTSHAIDEMSIFQKEYFKQLLALDSINRNELVEKIMKLKDKELEQLLVMFYAKITNIVHARNKGLEIKAEEIQALIDEASHEIFLIAEFTDQDAISSVKERATLNSEPLASVYNKLSMLYIALKFGELIDAKNTYKDMVKEYNILSNKDKSIIYTDTVRAFHAINYLEKQYKE